MKARLFTIGAMASAMSCAMLAGCDRGNSGANSYTNPRAGVVQTKFPGEITAGGLTSGEVMARSSKPETNAEYAGGTPGIAGGAGGNTGGAALGGTVAESGQGPSSGTTTPAKAGQPGNRPSGDYGGPPADAPQAGVTPVGAGAATNEGGAPPPVNPNNATGTNAKPGAGSAPGQTAKPAGAAPTQSGQQGAAAPPTQSGPQGAAAQKAAAAAEAEQAKTQLLAVEDAIAARWRSEARSKGWTTRSPEAGAAAGGASGSGDGANAGPVVPSSGTVPAAVQTTGVAITGQPMPGVAPRTTGVSANTITGTPAGNAAASPGGGAAPRSPQAMQSANVPIKSEKHGTAAPSADVKNAPTGSVKPGVSPGVDRGSAEEKLRQ